MEHKVMVIMRNTMTMRILKNMTMIIMKARACMGRKCIN